MSFGHTDTKSKLKKAEYHKKIEESKRKLDEIHHNMKQIEYEEKDLRRELNYLFDYERGQLYNEYYIPPQEQEPIIQPIIQPIVQPQPIIQPIIQPITEPIPQLIPQPTPQPQQPIIQLAAQQDSNIQTDKSPVETQTSQIVKIILIKIILKN